MLARSGFLFLIHFLSKQAFFDFAQSFPVFQKKAACQNKLFLKSHSLFADFQEKRLGKFQKESFSQDSSENPPMPHEPSNKKGILTDSFYNFINNLLPFSFSHLWTSSYCGKTRYTSA